MPLQYSFCESNLIKVARFSNFLRFNWGNPFGKLWAEGADYSDENMFSTRFTISPPFCFHNSSRPLKSRFRPHNLNCIYLPSCRYLLINVLFFSYSHGPQPYEYTVCPIWTHPLTPPAAYTFELMKRNFLD